VSTRAALPGSKEPATVQVHLKSNFQYRNRGSKYSIPVPKPGNAKGSHNIILREDQIEFQRGVKSEAVRARKEGKRIASALAASGREADGSKTWLDPDWMPDMLLGQSSRRGSALPDVGYGKRNPNQVRKKNR
jgi:RNA-binding protein NOB1